MIVEVRTYDLTRPLVVCVSASFTPVTVTVCATRIFLMPRAGFRACGR
jgi:hypothetical protein